MPAAPTLQGELQRSFGAKGMRLRMTIQRLRTRWPRDDNQPIRIKHCWFFFRELALYGLERHLFRHAPHCLFPLREQRCVVLRDVVIRLYA